MEKLVALRRLGGAPFWSSRTREGRRSASGRAAPSTWTHSSSSRRDWPKILARVHERDVVHRDINPSNIVLDATGAPTLVDFDRATTGATAPADGAGTSERGDEKPPALAYASPEQLGRANRAVDGAQRPLLAGDGVLRDAHRLSAFPFRRPALASCTRTWRACRCRRRSLRQGCLASSPASSSSSSEDARGAVPVGCVAGCRPARGAHPLAEDGGDSALELGPMISGLSPGSCPCPSASTDANRNWRPCGRPWSGCPRGRASWSSSRARRGSARAPSSKRCAKKWARVRFVSGNSIAASPTPRSCRWSRRCGDLSPSSRPSRRTSRCLARPRAASRWRQRAGAHGARARARGGPRGAAGADAGSISLDARARLHVTLQALVQAFASEGKPLVLFIDDLQWADAAASALVRSRPTRRACGCC